MNIPLLTAQALKQNLPQIKAFAGFELQTHHHTSALPFLHYIYSWLSAYESKQSVTEPTWSSFLHALRCVKLTELAKLIEDCLKTAPAVVEAKERKGTVNLGTALLIEFPCLYYSYRN